ncbi:pilus assembly protein TadG-related protein [Novosphingobium sp. PhB55]|uniref:pilus assembly protein TadG-related protein n=1 Tax=unclassified Novosphingobium TaxID=2644732 RepID=UPI0010D54B01|nr:pilus assembly protein TadG-related protein [Novosphingobium sp. PhB55]TDW67129.1 putative membrane protein [Novosphingobium sp. PhB55]
MARLRPFPRLRPLRELKGDEGGVIGPMVAVLGVSLLGAAGLALDVGLYYQGNRDLRAATEAAALAAAMDPYRAEARARDYLTRNGYDPAVLKSVQIGRYCADIGQATDQRFDPTMARCPGNGLANAVRVVTSKASRRFLTGVLGEAGPIPDLTATASAARIDEAGVSVTSGLLTISNPLVTLVNNLLGALLGIQLRLTSTDIEGLMNGNVDAGLFFDALAGRTGFTGTYGDLIKGSYGLRDIATAAAAATTDAKTRAGLTAFAGQVTNSYRVPLSGLFSVGVWKNMPVGGADAQPALRAGMNAYQLVSFASQANPAVIDLSTLTGLVLPDSVASIKLGVSGFDAMPRFSFGPAGETSVGTSLIRLGVNLKIIDIPIPVLGDLAKANVPLIVDVAASSAKVSAIDCTGSTEQGRDTQVTVQANSGLVNVYLGSAPANALTKVMPPLTASDITPATIISSKLLFIPLLEVTARAAVQPVTGASSSLVFGPGGTGTVGSPSLQGKAVTIGNDVSLGATVTSLTTSLLDQGGLEVKPLGTCLGTCNTQLRLSLVNGVVQPVAGLVSGVVDPLLNNLLSVLGIQLGHATVWVTGARCGVPVLI